MTFKQVLSYGDIQTDADIDCITGSRNGDIDCVYHLSFNELIQVAKDFENEAVQDSLETMVEEDRLRDIDDFTFLSSRLGRRLR